MAQTKAEQIAKITEWQKENVKQYTIRFNREKDADILEELAKHKSVQGFIKESIRKNMQ